jgi:hypothetical protein
MASIDIHEFRDRLKIDKHDLDGELEYHSVCLERIGREVAQLNTRQASLKKDLEAAEAMTIARLKEDTKLSNPLAEKEAQRDPWVIKAWTHYRDAKQEYEEWMALNLAWTARGYNLKTLADLHGQGYYQIDTTVGKRTTYSQIDVAGRAAIQEASARVAAQRGELRRRT